MLLSQYSIFRELTTIYWLEQNTGRKKGISKTGRQTKNERICQTMEDTNKSSYTESMIDMQGGYQESNFIKLASVLWVGNNKK